MGMRQALAVCVSAVLVWAAAAPSVARAEVPSASSNRPNVVFILADDIGYGDLSCYGAKLVQTPNLDKLAAQGRRFTDVHTPASTCTPTRYALMTGRYAWRHKEGSAILAGDAVLSIVPGEQTLPATFQRAGYTTGIVGKWHLGLGEKDGIDWNGDIKPGPLEVGFDYGFYFPATGDRVPCVYIEGRHVVGLDPKDPIQVSYKHKVGDDPTGKEHPEELILKPTGGHDQTIVNGISRIGWMSGGNSARWVDEHMCDNLVKRGVSFIENNKDKPFFLYFATHNIHVPRVPAPRFRGKSQCGARGDAIVELDAAVGELMATLDRLHLADKTLVVFTSDNGGILDDGYDDYGSLDHKCNGTLRGHKGTLFEGGNRVPFISRWPGVISEKTESSDMFCLVDMEATFASLLGQKLDATAAPDSFNALDAVVGRPHEKPVREFLVMHNGGTQGPFAVRDGSWKLVQHGKGGYGNANKSRNGDIFADLQNLAPGPLLFDLSKDEGENVNLAAANPQKVAELKALLEKMQQDGHTRPGF